MRYLLGKIVLHSYDDTSVSTRELLPRPAMQYACSDLDQPVKTAHFGSLSPPGCSLPGGPVAPPGEARSAHKKNCRPRGSGPAIADGFCALMRIQMLRFRLLLHFHAAPEGNMATDLPRPGFWVRIVPGRVLIILPVNHQT